MIKILSLLIIISSCSTPMPNNHVPQQFYRAGSEANYDSECDSKDEESNPEKNSAKD
jgi:hypothetical protein